MKTVTSDDINLILPSEKHQKQVEEFKTKFPKDYDIPGATGLHALDFAAWLESCRNYMKGLSMPKDHVPATQYLAVRKSDNKLVGMLQIRHNLDSPILSLFGGHIGYCVAPDERRKGCGSVMLKHGLELAKKFGIDNAMVSCLSDNVGSAAVIKNNGGKFTREVALEDRAFHVYHIENK